MKLIKIKDISDNGISCEQQVIFEISDEETKELRNALLIVDWYKKNAFDSLKANEGQSDWSMVKYILQNNILKINIEQGMAG